VGKTLRGFRPTQQNSSTSSPSDSQRQQREYFTICTDFWNDTPYNPSQIGPCQEIQSKVDWYNDAQQQGKMCSYYDYFMGLCLTQIRSCVDLSSYGSPGFNECMREFDPFYVKPVEIFERQLTLHCDAMSYQFTGVCGFPPYRFTCSHGEVNPEGIWQAEPNYYTLNDVAFKYAVQRYEGDAWSCYDQWYDCENRFLEEHFQCGWTIGHPDPPAASPCAWFMQLAPGRFCYVAHDVRTPLMKETNCRPCFWGTDITVEVMDSTEATDTATIHMLEKGG